MKIAPVLCVVFLARSVQPFFVRSGRGFLLFCLASFLDGEIDWISATVDVLGLACTLSLDLLVQ